MLSARRQIAGVYLPDATRTRGYLLSKGRFTTFAVPDVPVTQVFGLNNREQIVGFTLTEARIDLPGARGFLLRSGPKGAFTPIQFPGAPRTIALGINDHTEIVGQYERRAPAGGPSLQRASAATQQFGTQAGLLTMN